MLKLLEYVNKFNLQENSQLILHCIGISELFLSQSTAILVPLDYLLNNLLKMLVIHFLTTLGCLARIREYKRFQRNLMTYHV